jgi:stage II sporulation protein D
VTLDRYTAGVVPREIPVSWERAAVNAQAVAARTYGRYAVEHAAPSAEYDICDTTACQVYGGHAEFDASGTQVASDYPQAAVDTSDKVVTYNGATIFAQFSASNGGWTVDGGQPYMTAVADPYDPTADNPYINVSKTIKVSTVATFFHLHTVTKIEISQRDGHGTWGGRTLAGSVYGTNTAKAAVVVAVDGFDLQAAFGIGTTWFELLSSPAPA